MFVCVEQSQLKMDKHIANDVREERVADVLQEVHSSCRPFAVLVSETDNNKTKQG